MAISASQIATTNTLEQFRTEFNILRDDVSGLEDGSVTFTEITATSLGSTSIAVREDGTIIFEGATDDAAETTLTVVDPTADRTITFPDETGTVHTSGGDTTHTNIIIGDAGTIGSASDVDAITIAANGQLTLTQTLIGTALDISGDIDVDGTTNLDIVDIDGAVNIAADTTIASTNKIIFNDASQFIHAPSATVLDLAATDEIELTATLVDVVGNFTNSGTIVSAGNIHSRRWYRR